MSLLKSTKPEATKAEVWLEIKSSFGTFEFDLVECGLEYPLMGAGASGNLPAASFSVLSGSCIDTRTGGSVFVDAGKVLGRLTKDDEVNCWARIRGRTVTGDTYPADKLLLWHGYPDLSSLTKQKTAKGVSFSFVSRHWLNKLDIGSIFLSDFVKNEYNDLLYSFTTGTEADVSALNTLTARTFEAINVQNKTNDLFEYFVSTMKTHFSNLSDAGGSRKLNSFFSNLKCNLDDPTVDKLIENTFTGGKSLRMLTDSGDFTFNNRSEFVRPDMNLQVESALMATQVRAAVVELFLVNLGSSSVFDKIITLCNSFGLAVISGVKYATMAPLPLVMNARNTWRRIKESEYTLIKMVPKVSNDIAGVIISKQPQQSDVGQVEFLAQSREALEFANVSLVGAYVGDSEGSFIVEGSPFFLDKKAAAELYRRRVTSESGESQRGSTHRARSKTTISKSLEESTPLEQDDAEKMACGYARQRYLALNYGGSQAVVSGPLRLDIAPGSAVTIETDEGDFCGTVTNVSINFSAITSEAKTTIAVGFFVPEERARILGIDQGHPYIGSTIYKGNPLLKLNGNDLVARA